MISSDMQSLHNLPKKSYLQYISLFPIAKTAQARSYLTLMLTLVAVIGFSIFAISPTVNTIIELRKQLEDRTFANEALLTKIDALDSLQDSYLAMGTDLERIGEAIPTSPEVPQLLAGVQTLAVQNNLDIVSLDTSKVDLTKQPKEKTPVSFTFTVVVSGTYNETLQFIESMKRSGRIMSVESIAINREEGTSELETTIGGRAYFHPEVL